MWVIQSRNKLFTWMNDRVVGNVKYVLTIGITVSLSVFLCLNFQASRYNFLGGKEKRAPGMRIEKNKRPFSRRFDD